MAIFSNLSRKTKLRLALILALILVSGLLRLFLLENINYELHHVYYNTETSSMSAMLSPLSGLSYKSLVLCKWIITLTFTMVSLSYTIWAIKLIFNNKTYLKLVVYCYAAMLLVGFILYAIDGWIVQNGTGFSMSRYVMGIAQSPLPLFLLIPIFNLAEQK